MVFSPSGAPTAPLLDRPRPCVRCTYDLFRQPLDGKCPECGTEVTVSLRARYLRDAGPAYLRALRQGANLIVALVLVALVGLGVGLVGTYLMDLGVSWRASAVFRTLLDLGLLAATWRLTAADPGRPRPLSRWAARAIVLSLVVVQVAIAASAITGVDASGKSPLLALRGILAMLVAATALEAASTLAFGFTVAGLSQRLPASGLARAVRVASVGLFLTLLAALGGHALFLAQLHSRLFSETTVWVSRLLMWSENTGRAVFGLAAAVLLWTFARRLRAETAEAAEALG